jgi:hypothetical protein
MKINKYLETLGIIIGLSGVLVIFYYLITQPTLCIILFEPNIFIRIFEILLCLYSIFIFVNILIEFIKYVYKEGEEKC